MKASRKPSAAVPCAKRALASLGALLLAAVAAPGAARAEAMPKLDFGGSVTWLGQVPIMVAVDKGFFKEEGLDVGYQVILASSDRIAALTSGAVAFSNLGRSAVVAQMARGNKSFYYFANIDQAPGNEGCWARPAITSLAEARGKKIAANTSAEITIDGLLQTAGMSKRDIDYLDIPPNEMVAALTKGDVDAVCVWQPFLGAAEKAVPNGHLLGLDTDTESYKRYQTTASADILIISSKLVDEHPDEARKLAAAIFKGVDFANTHQKETAETVAHYFHQTPEEVLAGMKTFRYIGLAGWPAHMERQVKQMQNLAEWLHANQKIGTVPDVAKWENVSFLPAP